MRLTIITLLALSLLPAGIAHGDEPVTSTIDLSLLLIAAATLIITICVVIAVRQPRWKQQLFLCIAVPVVIATLYLAVSTVYTNITSVTGGPVHWHADFEVYNCGQPVDLIDPSGLLNRVGTSTLHEHGDNRVHVEGVVTALSDVDLHSVLDRTGGTLSQGHLRIPTTSGIVDMKDGNTCGTSPAVLQVFVLNVQDGKMVQRKLDLYDRYILSPQTNVPPGDCIIIEFDNEKQRTDHVCESYNVAIRRGDINGG